jgi:hypothetical protein
MTGALRVSKKKNTARESKSATHPLHCGGGSASSKSTHAKQRETNAARKTETYSRSWTTRAWRSLSSLAVCWRRWRRAAALASLVTRFSAASVSFHACVALSASAAAAALAATAASAAAMEAASAWAWAAAALACICCVSTAPAIFFFSANLSLLQSPQQQQEQC